MKTKSLFYTAVFVFSVMTVKAQTNIFPSTGNAGIGTTTPTTSLQIITPPVNGVGEDMFKASVSDAPNDFVKISNMNDINTTFSPVIWGHNSSNLVGLYNVGSIPSTGDNGTYPVIHFMSRIYNPTTNVSTKVQNRNAFLFSNNGSPLLTLSANGNIGIGTANPTAKLEINGGNVALNDNYLYLKPNDTKHGLVYRYTYGGTFVDGPALFGLAGGALGTNTWGTEKTVLSWNNNGVGIGLSPVSGFDLSTNKIVLGTQSSVTNGYIEVNGSSAWGYNIKSNSIQPLTSSTPTKLFCGFNSYDNREVFVVQSNGNVKIGPGNYIGSAHSDYRLSVDGKVIAPSFYALDPTINWADYVFNKDYKLKSLDEVEKFISQNNHLPEVPSTQEVQSNGINLQEMDALLLKKVEELTLYMIEMKKEMNSLKQENTELKSVVLELSK